MKLKHDNRLKWTPVSEAPLLGVSRGAAQPKCYVDWVS